MSQQGTRAISKCNRRGTYCDRGSKSAGGDELNLSRDTRALRETWARIADDDDIGVANITCAGENAFCTGSDLKKSMPAQISDWLVPREYERSEITFIHERIGKGGAS